MKRAGGRRGRRRACKSGSCGRPRAVKRRHVPIIGMSMTMLCSQCGSPAERCERCAGALCPRRLCAELHEAACDAMTELPAQPTGGSSLSASGLPRQTAPTSRAQRRSRLRSGLHRRRAAVVRISQHRQAGRAALFIGDLDTAVRRVVRGARPRAWTWIGSAPPRARSCRTTGRSKPT